MEHTLSAGEKDNNIHYESVWSGPFRYYPLAMATTALPALSLSACLSVRRSFVPDFPALKSFLFFSSCFMLKLDNVNVRY